MKKRFVPCGAIVLIAIFLFPTCIREVIYTSDDMYTSFPEAQILGASFYYQLNGQDMSGENAGMISKNEDGTYHVKMRRRSPSSSPTAMFITGSFEFSEFFKITCTFPEDPAIKDKPYRVYACASRGMDGNIDADYPTANDLMGEAVFRNGVAIGEFTLTNEGINYLNPDPWDRPYITVFLYLYFDKVTDPDDWYEFTLNYVGGANGIIPESVVTKAEVYREGDTENKFEPIIENYEMTDPAQGPVTKNFILARYNHRFDSRWISSDIPAINTSALCVNLQVSDVDVGKEIQFEIRNVGLYQTTAYPAPEGSNLVTGDMIKAAQVADLPASELVITERPVTPATTPPSYYYRVKAKVIRYSDMTGIKMTIPGAFSNTSRFTFTLNVPDKYVGEE
ncbi:MAG: hypothetical protein LBC52_00520 [Treponema sp.]|jgi:hypothetical protein|nr:hypothetical protein [Treponema sp.]